MLKKWLFNLILKKLNVLILSLGLCVLESRVYAVGGFNGSLRVRTVDAYDAGSDEWSACMGMEARRSTLGVAVLNNCIYAVCFWIYFKNLFLQFKQP